MINKKLKEFILNEIKKSKYFFKEKEEIYIRYDSIKFLFDEELINVEFYFEDNLMCNKIFNVGSELVAEIQIKDLKGGIKVKLE